MTMTVDVGKFGWGGGGGGGGAGGRSYVIEIKLNLITDLPCRSRVWNVGNPVLADGDLIGCWCGGAEEDG